MQSASVSVTIKHGRDRFACHVDRELNRAVIARYERVLPLAWRNNLHIAVWWELPPRTSRSYVAAASSRTAIRLKKIAFSLSLFMIGASSKTLRCVGRQRDVHVQTFRLSPLFSRSPRCRSGSQRTRSFLTPSILGCLAAQRPAVSARAHLPPLCRGVWTVHFFVAPCVRATSTSNGLPAAG
jgi:hypothetical protein